MRFVPCAELNTNLFLDPNEGKLWSNRRTHSAHLVLTQPLVDQSGARPKIERRALTLELQEFGLEDHPHSPYVRKQFETNLAADSRAPIKLD